MNGKTILHYRILEKLGAGGMGVVYKAEDTKLKRNVAIKFLPHQIAASEEERERFKIEAQAAAALNHPNIAHIYAIEEDDDEMFIVMEYIEGQELKSIIDERQLSIDNVVNYATQIAGGLQAAHHNGIVHRDVKSSNIMITDKGQVKIMDFGLAKVHGAALLTQVGTTMGTAAYMSPEQMRGEVVDQRTDIWAFGVVLYEMLAGQRPFAGEYQQAMMYAILHEEPQTVSVHRTDVPGVLEETVGKALAKNRDERYPDFGELLADLQAFYSTEEAPTIKTIRPVPNERAGKISRFGIPAAAMGIVLLLVVLLAFHFAGFGTADRKSIAVLPFENLSHDAEEAYFSDGITEDILAQISKIADIKVISSVATRKYRNTEKSPLEIGEELDVATLLAGSILRSGGRIRIRCQLVDTQTEEQMWAQNYDRELEDVFAIQSDVALKIATELRAHLSPTEKQRIEGQPTTDLTAYDYYLKGREFYHRYTRSDNEHAIELFKKSLALQPDYAPAIAGLADAYAQRPNRFGFSPVWLDSAIAVGQKAIKLAPDVAEGHKALGLAYLNKGMYDQALSATLEAVNRNPNYEDGVTNVGVIYQREGSFKKALQWLEKAIALDPTDFMGYIHVGDIFEATGKPDQAVAWYRKALSISPGSWEACMRIAGMFSLMADSEQYAQWMQKGIACGADSLWVRYYSAHDYLKRGEDKPAMALAQEMLARNPGSSAGLEIAGYVALRNGNLTEAKRYYRTAMQNNTAIETDYQTTVPIYYALILWQEGHRTEADKLLARSLTLRLQAIERGNQRNDLRQEIAMIHAIRGNKASAYDWLRKAIDAGWRGYRSALLDPGFQNLRGERRFQTMMAEVKGMVDEMRSRVRQNARA